MDTQEEVDNFIELILSTFDLETERHLRMFHRFSLRFNPSHNPEEVYEIVTATLMGERRAVRFLKNRLRDPATLDATLGTPLQVFRADESYMIHLCHELPKNLYAVARILGTEGLRSLLRIERINLPIYEVDIEIIKDVLHRFAEIKKYAAATHSGLFLPYRNGVLNVYRKVLEGTLTFNQLRCRDGSSRTGFLQDTFNRQIVIQEFLRRWREEQGFDMKDLPRQPNAKRMMVEYHLYRLYMSVGNNAELLFKENMPSFASSPHWASWRWDHHKTRTTSAESHEARKYLFEHVLGCRTKEEVIRMLNSQEKIFGAIISNGLSWLTQSRNRPRSLHPYHLIEGLDGSMYSIKPWETNLPFPKNYFFDSSHQPSIEHIKEFLGWVEECNGINVWEIPWIEEPNLRKFNYLLYSHRYSQKRLRTALGIQSSESHKLPMAKFQYQIAYHHHRKEDIIALYKQP